MHGRRDIAPTPWRDEIRATASLAWPLILTNVSQSLIQATDVLLLGRVGARTLAAAQLGVNLFVAFLIFGMGLVMAASPMMAKQLGMRRHSVRDVRRTVRQALWAATAITLPVWLILWHTEAILVAMGEDPGLSADGGALRAHAAMGDASGALLSRAALVRRGAGAAGLVARRRARRRRLQRADQLRR